MSNQIAKLISMEESIESGRFVVRAHIDSELDESLPLSDQADFLALCVLIISEKRIYNGLV